MIAGQVATAQGERQVTVFPTKINTPTELAKFAMADMVGAVKAHPPAWVQAFNMLARHVGLLVRKAKGKPMEEVEREADAHMLEGGVDEEVGDGADE